MSMGGGGVRWEDVRCVCMMGGRVLLLLVVWWSWWLASFHCLPFIFNGMYMLGGVRSGDLGVVVNVSIATTGITADKFISSDLIHSVLAVSSRPTPCPYTRPMASSEVIM